VKRWFLTFSGRKEMYLSNTLFISGIVVSLGLLRKLACNCIIYLNGLIEHPSIICSFPFHELYNWQFWYKLFSLSFSMTIQNMYSVICVCFWCFGDYDKSTHMLKFNWISKKIYILENWVFRF
jgi:hypothetical protein